MLNKTFFTQVAVALVAGLGVAYFKEYFDKQRSAKEAAR